MRDKPDNAQFCAAPGCKRWSRQYPLDGSGFLCGKHWMRGLSKRERAVMRRIWRLMHKAGPPYGKVRPTLGALGMREWRIWRAVIRRSAWISDAQSS